MRFFLVEHDYLRANYHIDARWEVQLRPAYPLSAKPSLGSSLTSARLGNWPPSLICMSTAEPFLQPHIIQTQWVRDGVHAVLPGEFDRSLPK